MFVYIHVHHAVLYIWPSNYIICHGSSTTVPTAMYTLVCVQITYVHITYCWTAANCVCSHLKHRCSICVCTCVLCSEKGTDFCIEFTYCWTAAVLEGLLHGVTYIRNLATTYLLSQYYGAPKTSEPTAALCSLMHTQATIASTVS